MLSRIFWIGIAGVALIVGMILQDGGGILSWGDDHVGISARTEHAIDEGIDRAIDASVVRMQVVGTDGEEINLSPETKSAFAAAIGRLVKAETDLAFIKARDGSEKELKAAEDRSAQARAEVDRLKAEIKRHDQATIVDSKALSEQIQRDVREDIRAEIRESVRN